MTTTARELAINRCAEHLYGLVSDRKTRKLVWWYLHALCREELGGPVLDHDWMRARGLLKGAEVPLLTAAWDTMVSVATAALVTYQPKLVDGVTDIRSVLTAEERETLFDRVSQPLAGAVLASVNDVRDAWIAYRAA